MGRTIPKQLLVIASVWLLITGMAVLDVVDLSDEFAHPWVVWDQAIDSELEESDDEFGAIAVVVSCVQPGRSLVLGSPARRRVLRLFDERESRPLFQQLTQYRI